MSLRVAFWSPHGWPSPNTHHVPVRRAEIPESFSGRRCQEALVPEWQGKDGLVTHKDWLAYAHKQAAGHHVTHQPHVRAWVSNTCLKSSQTRGWPPPEHDASPGSTKDGQMPFRSSKQSHKNWFIWSPTDVEGKKSFGVGEQGNMTSSTNKAETSCVNKACPLADLNHNSCGDLNQCSLVLSYPLKNIPYILFTQN